MSNARPFWSYRYSLYFLALTITLLLWRYLDTGSIMSQKYWGPSLFNPNSPHYSSDDSYPTGLLTVEIAEHFLADTSSSNLSQYTSIEDAAAEALAKHNGYLLSLNGLTELSETASEALAKFQGNLGLNGLASLSDAAANALSKHEGYLLLNSLTELSTAKAEALSKHDGRLDLKSLTSLSDVAAQALAKHEGDIYFNHDQLPPSASKILKDAGH